MRPILATLFVLCFCFTAYAGVDTSWLDRKWQNCKKEGAVYYSIKEKQDSLWAQRLYYAGSNCLFMKGSFHDEACILKTGTFTWYNSNNVLTDSIIYNNGKPVYLTHFHTNGKMKTLLTYNSHGATYVNSWDKSGNIAYCDTFYHDRAHNECHKDTAWLKGIIKKEDSIWHLQFFYMHDSSLYINSYYKERLCRTRIGTFTRYLNGKITDSSFYNNSGQKMAVWQFRNDCRLSSYRTFDSMGVMIGGKNWDQQGNERIFNPNVTYPSTRGGFKQWKKNLITRLNNDQSIDQNKRSGYYGTVHARLVIDKYGVLQAVYISDPSPFAEMDALIIRTIKSYENWKPGTVNGKPQDFTINCNLVFMEGRVSGEQENY
ncbi:MAG: energy transducer TonB [Ferruginibacter sp.]